MKSGKQKAQITLQEKHSCYFYNRSIEFKYKIDGKKPCFKYQKKHTNYRGTMNICIRFFTREQFPHDNPKGININLDCKEELKISQ